LYLSTDNCKHIVADEDEDTPESIMKTKKMSRGTSLTT